MRLSVELVARELARSHRIRVHGTAGRELALHRPDSSSHPRASSSPITSMWGAPTSFPNAS